jgi:hypothetical protein
MPRESNSVETGVKLTRAQIGMAEVVCVSSWTNAKFMAVDVDKNAVSLARGDGVEDVASPLLVTSVWRTCCSGSVSCGFTEGDEDMRPRCARCLRRPCSALQRFAGLEGC